MAYDLWQCSAYKIEKQSAEGAKALSPVKSETNNKTRFYGSQEPFVISVILLGKMLLIFPTYSLMSVKRHQ